MVQIKTLFRLKEGFFYLFTLLLFCSLISAKPCQARNAVITSKIIDNLKRKYSGPKLKRMLAWQSLINEHSNKPERIKLELANKFFNSLEYRSDAEQIGRTDYWMTPIEFLSRGGGDCEDFSIAKYFTLEAMGVMQSKMRITYVKALNLGVAHMVLTYYAKPRSMPLVLDNLINDIKPASERKDLKPVYSFNGSGLWLAKQRGQGRRVSGSGRLSMWQDLNRRMLRETR